MMKGIIFFLLIFGLGNGALAKSAGLEDIERVHIYIYDQKNEYQNAAKSKFVLSVFINGTDRQHHAGTFKVSPGMLRDKFEEGREPELTPEGVFYPQRLEREYVSKQFGGKVLGIFETGKMPYSIFFYNGFAIHGSYGTVDGKPASKGCVRLRVRDAQKVFTWVQAAIANTGSNRSVRINILDTESDYIAFFRRQPKN